MMDIKETIKSLKSQIDDMLINADGVAETTTYKGLGVNTSTIEVTMDNGEKILVSLQPMPK